MTKQNLTLNMIIKTIQMLTQVDAIYLYGSRANGTATEQSDWDIAVLFSDFLEDKLERTLRPQQLQQQVERELGVCDIVSIIDVEIAPIYLQYNIITAEKCYDRGVLHVRRVENRILSEAEKDYDNFQS